MKHKQFLRLVGISAGLLIATALGLNLVPNKAGATNLPVVNVSGYLSQNATWTAGNVYVLNNTIVPNGVKLTIEPGTIIKINGGYGLRGMPGAR